MQADRFITNYKEEQISYETLEKKYNERTSVLAIPNLPAHPDFAPVLWIVF
jgi:hypothetical protein